MKLRTCALLLVLLCTSSLISTAPITNKEKQSTEKGNDNELDNQNEVTSNSGAEIKQENAVESSEIQSTATELQGSKRDDVKENSEIDAKKDNINTKELTDKDSTEKNESDEMKSVTSDESKKGDVATEVNHDEENDSSEEKGMESSKKNSTEKKEDIPDNSENIDDEKNQEVENDEHKSQVAAGDDNASKRHGGMGGYGGGYGGEHGGHHGDSGHYGEGGHHHGGHDHHHEEGGHHGGDEHGEHEHEHHGHDHHHHDHGYEFYEEWGEHGGHEGEHHGHDEGGHHHEHEHGHEHEHEHEHQHEHEHGGHEHMGHSGGYGGGGGGWGFRDTVQAPDTKKKGKIDTSDKTKLKESNAVSQDAPKSDTANKKWWMVGDHWGGWGTDHWGGAGHYGGDHGHHDEGGWQYHSNGLHHGGGYGGGKSHIPDCCKSSDPNVQRRCGCNLHTGNNNGYHFHDHGSGYNDQDVHLQGDWTFGYDRFGDDWGDWDHNNHNFEHLKHAEHAPYDGSCRGRGCVPAAPILPISSPGLGLPVYGVPPYGGPVVAPIAPVVPLGMGGLGVHEIPNPLPTLSRPFTSLAIVNPNSRPFLRLGCGNGYPGCSNNIGFNNFPQIQPSSYMRVCRNCITLPNGAKKCNCHSTATHAYSGAGYGWGGGLGGGYGTGLGVLGNVGYGGIGYNGAGYNGVGYGEEGYGGAAYGGLGHQTHVNDHSHQGHGVCGQTHHITHHSHDAVHHPVHNYRVHHPVHHVHHDYHNVVHDVHEPTNVVQHDHGHHGCNGVGHGVTGLSGGIGCGHSYINKHQGDTPCIGRDKLPTPEPQTEESSTGKQGVVYPYVGYGPWSAYPWWGDWWGGHGHHGWGHGGHGGSEGGGHGHAGHGTGHAGTHIGHGGDHHAAGHDGHQIGFSGGMMLGGHHGGHVTSYHCRDMVGADNGGEVTDSKRFCVPVGYHGGYGWPYWHGYPGVGTGLWGWGWPWIKNKVPGGKEQSKTASESKEPKSETKVAGNAAPIAEAQNIAQKQTGQQKTPLVSGEQGSKDKEKSKTSTRDTIPMNHNEKKTKKQTIHVGYGYASGDNYRLGYGFGGMGGVAGFSGGNVNGGLGGPSGVERSKIPNAESKKIRTTRSNIPEPETPHDVTGNKRNFGENSHGFDGYGIAKMGHPVTHPGFTTMGYPGHALSSTDVKNKIPVVKSKRSLEDDELLNLVA